MHECEQDRRKSDTLPGAGCEEYCISCEVSEATALLPSHLPGSAGISKGFTPGICLSGVPTRDFSQPKQTNEEKKDSQTMPHARGRFVGCTCDDTMARARLSFPFPANGLAAAVGSNVVAVGDCTSSASVDVPVCDCCHLCAYLVRVYGCVHVVELNRHVMPLRGNVFTRQPPTRAPARRAVPPSTSNWQSQPSITGQSSCCYA
jgi:hypothetical protein